nr:hypothetical protein [Candidatus Sigynarchaeota archaeon]
ILGLSSLLILASTRQFKCWYINTAILTSPCRPRNRPMLGPFDGKTLVDIAYKNSNKMRARTAVDFQMVGAI